MKQSNASILSLYALLLVFVSANSAADTWVEEFETIHQASSNLTIHTQFSEPDSVTGLTDNAWRTDGFSSWAELRTPFSSGGDISFATWLAIESYPSDLERPADQLTPSSIAHQRDENRGFDLFIDTFGRWGVWVGLGEQEVKVQANSVFPLYAWTHVSTVIDSASKTVALYLNGTLVGQSNLPTGQKFVAQDTPLILAKGANEASMLNFSVNYLNGVYDSLVFSNKAFSEDQVRTLSAKYDVLPDAMDSLVVAPTRFKNDHLRPKFHAMPPANWTNEPHGLVRKDGKWHMFYQRTPNGPYKTQMHWGHMISDDLVHWRNVRDALWPELQTDDFGFDMKGIWSGDVIVDEGIGFAFYTSVNHFDRFKAANPGIAMAISRDPDLLYWEKMGPIIDTRNVSDFRDPYLWKEDDTWHMIIGAAYENYGGLDYYVLDRKDDKPQWKHKKKFSSISYRRLDIGSIIWEMPVFEPLSDDVHVLVVNPIGGAVTKYGEPGTRGVYWTGSWEDGVFNPHYKNPKPLDVLVGHLSPTVARGDDGHLRAIGIVDERRTSQAQEDAGWAHTFSFPRQWFLMPDGETLGQAPAPELQKLRGKQLLDVKDFSFSSIPETLASGHHAYEILLDNINLESGNLVVELFANEAANESTLLQFDIRSGRVTLDKSESNLKRNDEGPLQVAGQYDVAAFGIARSIRVFIDGSIVDVFINDAAAFSFRAYPSKSTSDNVRLRSSEAMAAKADISVWLLGG